MKIAMIGHKRIPSREGGVEIVVEELATRLVAQGHIVHAYNRKGHHVSGKENGLNSAKSRNYKGIQLIFIPTFQNGKLNAIVYSVIATLRALFGRYDVIHFHAEGPCCMVWLPHLFGIHTVATIHGLDWQRAKWGNFAAKFLKFGERMAARYADEVIVLSTNVQNYFAETYGRKVKFVPNGISKPKIRAVENIKEKFNLDKDCYILFLARIVPEKGLHYLLEAFREVDTPMKLVIAGGSSHTDDYMAEIKKRAKEDARVVMTGFVQGEELEELYSNAYMYVLPSDIEGMPISLLEAMSYGNCCLVSDIPENVEVVGDKAVTFKQGDVVDLQNKLNKMVNDEMLVTRYKAGARQYILNRYNWNTVVEETKKLYRKLLDPNQVINRELVLRSYEDTNG